MNSFLRDDDDKDGLAELPNWLVEDTIGACNGDCDFLDDGSVGSHDDDDDELTGMVATFTDEDDDEEQSVSDKTVAVATDAVEWFSILHDV